MKWKGERERDDVKGESNRKMPRKYGHPASPQNKYEEKESEEKYDHNENTCQNKYPQKPHNVAMGTNDLRRKLRTKR